MPLESTPQSFSLCEYVCVHTHSSQLCPQGHGTRHLPVGADVVCPFDPPVVGMDDLSQTEIRRGRSPALAQGEAGPRAACAHCGDAWTPPRRSHPSHAGEGSGSDEWYRGSPRECGFLGWGSPSSGAVHKASPRERERII